MDVIKITIVFVIFSVQSSVCRCKQTSIEIWPQLYIVVINQVYFPPVGFLCIHTLLGSSFISFFKKEDVWLSSALFSFDLGIHYCNSVLTVSNIFTCTRSCPSELVLINIKRRHKTDLPVSAVVREITWAWPRICHFLLLIFCAQTFHLPRASARFQSC